MTLPFPAAVLTASAIALADMYEEGMLTEHDVAEALVQCVCDYYEDSANYGTDNDQEQTIATIDEEYWD